MFLNKCDILDEHHLIFNTLGVMQDDELRAKESFLQFQGENVLNVRVLALPNIIKLTMSIHLCV